MESSISGSAMAQVPPENASRIPLLPVKRHFQIRKFHIVPLDQLPHRLKPFVAALRETAG